MNTPVGFVDLGAELSVFISALADIGILVNNPETVNEEEINRRIIGKLKSILPAVRGYFAEAFNERLETRSRLIDKIYFKLSTETRIVLEPLLVRFVDDYLVGVYRRNREGIPEYSDQRKDHSISFLGILVDGYIAAIQKGEASRIYVSELLAEQICSPRFGIHSGETFDFVNFLRITFAFARRFGVELHVEHPDWSRERNLKLRVLISECVQLRCYNSWVDIVDDLTDDQLNDVETVLSKLVARHNFLLSIGEDDASALVRADDFLIAVASEDETYLSWIFEHISIELSNIPERLIQLSKRATSVHRSCRRKIGGAVGGRLENILSACLDFPSNVLRLEIQWKIIDAEHSEDLNFRNSLEAVFMDFLDWIEFAAHIVISHGEPASDIVNSLETQFRRGGWWLALPFAQDHLRFTNAVKKEIDEFSAIMNLETATLLKRFPGTKPG